MEDGSCDGLATQHIGRRDFAFLAFTLAASLAAGCAAGAGETPPPDSPVSRPRRVKPSPVGGGAAFPRSAVYFLAQENLPTANELARYDLVVIDSEWFGRLGPAYFTDLRTYNRDVRVLAYVNVVDFPYRVGSPSQWADRYALWQFKDSTTSVFPREWLATTAEGQLVSGWPDTWMANLTDATRRIAGRTYAQYAAEWVVKRVWPAGVWDGIFLDVWGDRIWSADHDAWDYGLGGTDTPDAEIYGAGNPWERGINDAEIIMRAGMPNAILVANGTRTMRNGQLNGRVWESFLDRSKDEGRGEDLQTYMKEVDGPGVRQPPYAMTISTQGAPAGSPEDYRRARYFLTATLLQNAYWAPMVDNDYAAMNYYDEIDGAGIGRGYLGHPVVSNPTWDQLNKPFANGFGTIAPGVYRRDFENGVVLHNHGTTRQTIKFDRRMRLLKGKQDPAVNTGEVVDSVDLSPHDGRILLPAED